MRKRTAFTLVELMVGAVVTTLVMSAVAFFLSGIGLFWRDTAEMETAESTTRLGLDRVTRLIRGSKLEQATADGCMIWSTDANGDGKMQLSELALLRYEPAASALTLYQIQWPAGWGVGQIAAADVTISPAVMPDEATFLAEPYVVGTKLIRSVTACSIEPTTPAITGGRPGVDLVVTVDGVPNFMTASVRAPNGTPK